MTSANVQSDPDLVLRSDTDGVAVLSLNAPKSINALSEAMLHALSDTFDKVAEDRSVKAVILRSGDNHFCAGHNLKEMSARRADADGGFQYFQDLFATCSAMMLRVVRLPQPVIAEVKGIATAAGCQLVASCDLAVASDDATFATSGVNIGLFCSTPMVALSRNVGAKHAMEMLLTGEMVPAARAAEIGLVNAVVGDADLTDHVTAVAHKIASKSPITLAIGKSAFYTQRELSIADAYEYASRVMVENMLHRDAVEGIDAFIEKREPKW